MPTNDVFPRQIALQTPASRAPAEGQVRGGGHLQEAQPGHGGEVHAVPGQAGTWETGQVPVWMSRRSHWTCKYCNYREMFDSLQMFRWGIFRSETTASQSDLSWQWSLICPVKGTQTDLSDTILFRNSFNWTKGQLEMKRTLPLNGEFCILYKI